MAVTNPRSENRIANYFTGGGTYQKSAVFRGQTAATLQVAEIRLRYCCSVVFTGAYIPGITVSYECHTMLARGLKAYSSAYIITVLRYECIPLK